MKLNPALKMFYFLGEIIKLHEKNIFHGDIKPDNISETGKIIDMGSII